MFVLRVAFLFIDESIITGTDGCQFHVLIGIQVLVYYAEVRHLEGLVSYFLVQEMRLVRYILRYGLILMLQILIVLVFLIL